MNTARCVDVNENYKNASGENKPTLKYDRKVPNNLVARAVNTSYTIEEIRGKEKRRPVTPDYRKFPFISTPSVLDPYIYL